METILTSALVTTGLSSIFAFIAKNWWLERLKGAIKSEYDEKLETHKAQLKVQNDKEIEDFKAKMHLLATERSIKLTRVFETTVETIAATYEKLLALKDAVEYYMSPIETSSMPTKEERRKDVAIKYNEFIDYYRPRAVFLPKEVIKKIEELKLGLKDTVLEFMIEVENQTGNTEARKSRRESWFKTQEYINQKVPPLLDALDDDLRKILGTKT